jgi:hypothetical protein
MPSCHCVQLHDAISNAIVKAIVIKHASISRRFGLGIIAPRWMMCHFNMRDMIEPPNAVICLPQKCDVQNANCA